MKKAFLIFLGTVLVCFGNIQDVDAQAKPSTRCCEGEAEGKLIYLGPAHDIGPGYILRKQGKGYGLSFLLSDVEPDTNLVKSLIATGKAETECTLTEKGNRSIGMQLAGGLGILGSIGFAIGKADSVYVHFDSCRWDDLAQGKYEATIKKLPADNPVAQDVNLGTRHVLTSALFVRNLSVTYVWTKGAKAGAEARAKGNISNGRANANWVKDGKLVMTVTGGCYLRATVRPISSKGIAGTKSIFGELEEIPSDAEINYDAYTAKK